MEWQPSPESLTQLAAYLKDSLSASYGARQKQAEAMLEQAKSSPDFNNYLAYLFSSPEPPRDLQLSPAEYHVVRSAAGIMMKNNVRSSYRFISQAGLSLMRMAVPIGIQDKNSQIRNYAGNLATELIQRGGLMSWPGILPELIDLMTNASGQVPPETQEGAMSAMTKICEDNSKAIHQVHNGQRPLQYILPKLIVAAASPLRTVRVQALIALNIFSERRSQPLTDSVDVLLQCLFTIATDENADVRRQICRAFVNLIGTHPDKIKPYIEGLVNYIITQQKSDDEELACEAADFWLTVGEATELLGLLEPHVHKIVPVLLESMVYSGEEIALLGGDTDDEDEEDRQEDIKPLFANKSASRTVNGKGSASMNAPQKPIADKALASLDDDIEDGEVDKEEDGAESNPEERWNVRKCSAAALEVLACDFKEPVFKYVMPYLESNLKHPEWPVRESAVLVLGAIATGCKDQVRPYLPELVLYLVTLLKDPEPVLRQITCWTLSCYSSWASHLKDDTERTTYFVPIMDGLLCSMLDKNKKVQEAAASAFATLEEAAGKTLEPYCGPIVRQFVCCFPKYKSKNMHILYECVQALAEHTGPTLASKDNVEQLMPALIKRYDAIADDSRELFSLLECLSYVAVALNNAFVPFARPIFERCIKIIRINLELSMAAINNPAQDPPDKDFLVTSLDLLSAIIQALDDDNASELVKEQSSFFELLVICLEDPNDGVRQSAYALLGDCSKYVFPLLQPHLGTILPILIKQLDLETLPDDDAERGLAIITNACWAAGEIAMRHGEGMAFFIPELLGRCIALLDNALVSATASENASVCIGRLGLGNSEQLAEALPTFAEKFLSSLEEVGGSLEKETALEGFTKIVGKNPHAMENDLLLSFFSAIAGYRDLKLQKPINDQLHDMFQFTIDGYKHLIPRFNEFLGQMSVEDQQALKSNYVI